MSELKDTLLMPSTGFEMRGNLTIKEPKMIEKWHAMNLYEKKYPMLILFYHQILMMILIYNIQNI